MMFCALFWSYVILNCWHGSSGQSYNNMTGLLTSVLSGYNNDVRPLEDQSGIMAVNLSLNLYNILDVDTVKGVITVVMSLACTWHDERIRWNSSDYGGINSIKIQQQYVWTPELVNTRPVEFISVGQKWMHVTYQPNGLASWTPGGVYKMACPMNIQNWPFDEQSCDLRYMIYDYKDSDVLLQTAGISSSFLPENGEWDLKGTSVTTSHSFGQSELVFTLKLKRRIVFYLDTLIIPLFCLQSLGFFVFLLPSESGERIGYCMTILLSITVFLDVISDEIPKLSNPIPIICQILLVGVIKNSLITISVVLNLWIYHRTSVHCNRVVSAYEIHRHLRLYCNELTRSDKVPIGKFYRFIVKLARCKRRNNVSDETTKPNQDQLFEKTNMKLAKCKRRNTVGVETTQSSQDQLFEKSKMSKLMHKCKELFGDTMIQEVDDTEEVEQAGKAESTEGEVPEKKQVDCEVTWKDVSIAFDRILFVLTGLVTGMCIPVTVLVLQLDLL